MQPDGSYIRLTLNDGQRLINTQEYLLAQRNG